MSAPNRQTPLVVVASQDAATADTLAEQYRRDGAVAYATHSMQGCLRVATAVAPDMVVLDCALPNRLTSLLRAHPACADAKVVQFRAGAAAAPAAPRTLTRLPRAA